MKENLKELAEALFVKTDLTKTEIAQLLGISRRTIHYWAADNAWERLKNSTDNLPSIGVENAWFIFNSYQEKLLAADPVYKTFTNDEINNLYKLGSLVRKLTRGNAINETIEVRNRFMEFVTRKNPDLALTVQSLMDEYIRTLARIRPRALLGGKLDEFGRLIKKEKNIREAQLDIEDRVRWYDNGIDDELDNNKVETGTPHIE